MVAAPSRRAGLCRCAGPGAQPSFRAGTGFGLGSGSAPLEITPGDYETFERLLNEIQAAWANEDVARLHTLATPEMVSYVTGDLAEYKSRNQVNLVSGVKLLQGDLAEAWREGDTDFASVAMRYSLIDKTIDRTTGLLVKGSDQPTEATEVWTFLRERGACLGAFGDPAGLIPCNVTRCEAPRFSPWRLFICAGLAGAGIMLAGTC